MAAKILIGLLILANIAALLALLRWAKKLQRRLKLLAMEQERLSHVKRLTLTAELSAQLQEGRRFLTVEILNPVELASKESKFAGPIAAVSPALIRKMVYEQAAEILAKELAAKGLQASVEVHDVV